MRFAVLEPDHGPWPEMGVRVVRGASLTRVERGALRTPDGKRFIRGAVYDSERRLVPQSQRFVPASYPWLPGDNGRIPPLGDPADHLAGRWLYGGHWAQHFGHFMLETLSTLWPDPRGVSGLVFHQYLRKPFVVEAYQQRALDLLGLAGLEVRVVDGAPVSVEELVVPSRAMVPNAHVTDEARDVWQRVAGAAGRGDDPGPRRVYLSRTLFNRAVREQDTGRPARTSSARDAELDEVFGSRGFEVVHPETLSLDEQLTTMAGAEVLAGLSGSALHMSAFAHPAARVIEIGDTRDYRRPSPMQRAIDGGYGRCHAYAPRGTSLRTVDRFLKRLARAHPQ